MSDRPAAFFARRLREEHEIQGPATAEQLLAICEARGCRVVRSATLIRSGYYLATAEGPMIVLRWDAGPHVLAHELYHHVMHDNQSVGVVYSYPEWGEIGCNPDDEAAANLFADLMCRGPF